jgi:membrane protease YdiL (CAAX protease family)
MTIIKNAWRTAAFIFLALLVSVFASVVKSFLGLAAFLAVFVITRLALIFILGKVYRRERADSQSGRRCIPLTIAVPLAVAAGISLNLLCSGLIGILTPDAYNAAYYIDKSSLSGLLLAEYAIGGILWGCLLTPLTEELLFRGIVFSRLRGMAGLVPAVIIQAVLFGAVHTLTQGSLLQGLYTSCLGIAAALFILWTGSIWASFAAHAAFNTLSIIFDLAVGFHTLPASSFPFLIIIGAAMLVLTLFFAHRAYKS